MTGFTDEKLDEIRQKLEKEKRDVEERIQGLTSQDPYTDTSRLDDNADIASEAGEESDHERFSAIVGTLTRRVSEINDALVRLGIGTYGVCTGCGGAIEPQRLVILPTATLCLECEREKR